MRTRGRKIFKKAILRNNKGFTLVELLLTIAVMAILSSIVLPSMSSANNRQLAEQYKQSCISVLDTTEIIFDAVNKGSRKVSGFTIIKNDGSVDYNELKRCLKLENFNGSDYDIVCFDVTAQNNGSTGTCPISLSNYSKDFVAVYICSNSVKDQFYPAGAIYYKKTSRSLSAQIKYDYVVGGTVDMRSTFSNPF